MINNNSKILQQLFIKILLKIQSKKLPKAFMNMLNSNKESLLVLLFYWFLAWLLYVRFKIIGLSKIISIYVPPTGSGI